MVNTSEGAAVPAFLTKLWKLVEDSKYNQLISWSKDGKSFIIHNQTRFAKDLLPLYFKHNNMASFIRQLNMYGFRKSTSIENSGLKSDKDEMEFYHQYFLRGQEGKLEFIKRKIAGNPAKNALTPVCEGSGLLKTDDVKEMLTGIHAIRERQENADNCLVALQNENQVLWKELVSLKRRHEKQQKIVEKLIQFLMTIVSNAQGVSMKRKAQLMIDSSDGLPFSKRFMATSEDMTNASPIIIHDVTNETGPVIHDVTNDPIDAELEANKSPIVSTDQLDLEDDIGSILGIQSCIAASDVPAAEVVPDSNQNEVSNLLNSEDDLLLGLNDVAAAAADSSLVSTSTSEVPVTISIPDTVTTQATTSTSTNEVDNLILDNFTKEYFTDQVEGTDVELSWLRDQLVSGLDIDPGLLSGCFSDDSLSQSSTSSNKE